MSKSFIIGPGVNARDPLACLTKMLEREFVVTGIRSTPESEGGQKWRASCDDAFGNTMVISSHSVPSKCVRFGIEIQHVEGDNWTASPLAEKPVKKRVPVEEPEPDFNTIAFAWPASTAGKRVTDSLNHLLIWEIITPEEQAVFLNRMAQYSKGGK